MTAPAANGPLLHVEDLAKSFSTRRSVLDALRGRPVPKLVAVDGVSFDVRPHEALGIVGESGSGKSTVAKCLVRLEEPDSGSMLFRSEDVRTARGQALSRIRRSMQLIYQDPYSSLNPLMTVQQAVTEPAVVHGLLGDASAGAHAANLLRLVGLGTAVADRRPHELSGGQRQRVAIARAMAVQPELLIADEAVSSLDVSIQAQVLNVLAKLRAEQGIALVFIAHQLAVVSHVAERILVMYLGRTMESGPTHTVLNRPAHPYTAGLLDSQPGTHRRGANWQPALRGEIPSPLAVPSGCRFRTRCPIAQPICAEVDPPPVELSDGQRSWCHFATEFSERRVAAGAAR